MSFRLRRSSTEDSYGAARHSERDQNASSVRNFAWRGAEVAKSRSGKSSPWHRVSAIMAVGACLLGSLWAQAGRQAHPASESSTMVNVVAVRANGASGPITAKEISFF